MVRLQVLVAATADVNSGCSGEIIGVIGGFEDTCTVEVSAADASVVQNADTEIFADAISEACKADEDVIATVDVTATVCTPHKHCVVVLVADNIYLPCA